MIVTAKKVREEYKDVRETIRIDDTPRGMEEFIDESQGERSKRERSPSDAIVVTWWDYGYWTEYVADRRVLADGGSLRSHVPYWMGKSLLAPTDQQSVGLLRMLECGSDTTPESGGNRYRGAFGKLRAQGLDDVAPDDAVMALARGFAWNRGAILNLTV